MRSIPKDSVSISRLAAGLAPTGISRAGLVAAAKIMGLHITGDLLHFPKSIEKEFFDEAQLATEMLESQKKRLNRETQ
jgi:hypothetical protein